MKVSIEKCEQCGALFEDEAKYADHMLMHQKLTVFDGAFPEVEDEGYNFANGGWAVQRDADWLKRYKDRILVMVGDLGYTPQSYGWFRCLDDGGHAFYSRACRMLNVCPKCFREWGQPYYANNCKHEYVVKDG